MASNADAFAAIDALGDLPRDWDSYEATPIAVEALDRAKGLLEGVARDLGIAYRNPLVSPTLDSGVSLIWRKRGHANVEAFVSRQQATYVVMEKGELIERGQISSSESLVSVLRRFTP